MRCQGGLDSFGRRRRSIEANDTEAAPAEYRTHQIHFSIPVPSSASNAVADPSTIATPSNISKSSLDTYNLFQYSRKRDSLMDSSSSAGSFKSHIHTAICVTYKCTGVLELALKLLLSSTPLLPLHFIAFSNCQKTPSLNIFK